MAIDAHKRILFGGLGIFFVTLAVTLVGARRVLTFAPAYIPEEPVSLWYLLFLFLLATAVIVFLLRFVHGRALFHIFFTAALFVGVWFLADIFLPGLFAVAAGAVVVLARYLAPRVATQNLLVVLGISGVAVSIGLALPWQTVLALSAILAVYDIAAVYWSGHMVQMMKGLLERGVIFAVILPAGSGGYRARLDAVSPGKEFMMIGTGDLAIPAMFVASLAPLGVASAALAGVGALLGFAATSKLFLSQRTRRPMPALPPIVAGMAIGFLIATLIA